MLRVMGYVVWAFSVCLALGLRAAAAVPAVPELVVQQGNEYEPSRIIFSADGRYLAANGGGVAVWDLKTGKELRRFDPRMKCSELDFVPGATDLMIACDTGVSQLMLRTLSYASEQLPDNPVTLPLPWAIKPQEATTFASQFQGPRNLRYTPDGESLLANLGKQVQLYRRDGQALAMNLKPSAGVAAFTLDAQGRVITLSEDGLRWWNLATGDQQTHRPAQKLLATASPVTAPGHSGTTTAGVAVSADGERVAVLGKAGRLSLQTRLGPTPGWQAEKVQSFDLAPDGRSLVVAYATVDRRAEIVCYEWGTDRVLWRYTVTRVGMNGPLALRYSPSGHVLALSDSLALSLLEAETGREVQRLSRQTQSGMRVRLSPDLRYLAYLATANLPQPDPTAGPQLFVWDLQTGRRIRALGPEQQPVDEIHWVEGGRLAALLHLPDGQSQIQLIEPATGAVVKRLPAAAFAMPGFGFQTQATFIVSEDRRRLYYTIDPKGPGNQNPTGFKTLEYDLGTDQVRTTQLPQVGRSAAVQNQFLDISKGDGGSFSGSSTISRWPLDGSQADYQLDAKVWSGTMRPFSRLALPVHGPSGRFITYDTSTNLPELRDLADGHLISKLDWSYGWTAAFSPDGSRVAAVVIMGLPDQPKPVLKVWTLPDMNRIESYPLRQTAVSSGLADFDVAFSPDQKTVYVASAQSGLYRLDLTRHTLDSMAFVNLRTGGALVTDQGYYLAERQALGGMAFRQGAQAFPFEQFDLRFNRPDKVLEALKSPRTDLIAAYRQAWLRRIKRLGFSEEQLAGDLVLPEVELLSQVPASTRERRLKLKLRAKDASTTLANVNVYVNDVPLYGRKGLDLSATPASSHEHEVEVELGQGRNRIQIAATNARGLAALRETVEVSYTGPAEPEKLHVIALGVSDYQDRSRRLTYAAKDASDLTAFFRGRAASVTLLRDGEVTRERVLALKQALMQTGVDDRVILFLAGHGLLDGSQDYYFGTHDIDFGQPQARGLAFEAIEDLLDGIPARKKLLLMDTCHAGELDKELPLERFAVANGQVQARSLRGIRVKGALPGAELEYLLQDSFVNLRQGSGTQTIAASAGMEFAFEAPDWHNGVFTYSLLKGLRDRAADQNRDGKILSSELQRYVAETVPALTQGRQHPVVRTENLAQDIPLD